MKKYFKAIFTALVLCLGTFTIKSARGDGRRGVTGIGSWAGSRGTWKGGRGWRNRGVRGFRGSGFYLGGWGWPAYNRYRNYEYPYTYIYDSTTYDSTPGAIYTQEPEYVYTNSKGRYFVQDNHGNFVEIDTFTKNNNELWYVDPDTGREKPIYENRLREAKAILE